MLLGHGKYRPERVREPNLLRNPGQTVSKEQIHSEYGERGQVDPHAHLPPVLSSTVHACDEYKVDGRGVDTMETVVDATPYASPQLFWETSEQGSLDVAHGRRRTRPVVSLSLESQGDENKILPTVLQGHSPILIQDVEPHLARHCVPFSPHFHLLHLPGRTPSIYGNDTPKVWVERRGVFPWLEGSGGSGGR